MLKNITYDNKFMITKFKIFESVLLDLPYPKNIKRRSNLREYKYKENDIVYHKKMKQPYIVQSINDCSENQDYYLYNPITNDKGFVMEEELRNATPNEKLELETVLKAQQYNL